MRKANPRGSPPRRRGEAQQRQGEVADDRAITSGPAAWPACFASLELGGPAPSARDQLAEVSPRRAKSRRDHTRIDGLDGVFVGRAPLHRVLPVPCTCWDDMVTLGIRVVGSRPPRRHRRVRRRRGRRPRHRGLCRPARRCSPGRRARLAARGPGLAGEVPLARAADSPVPTADRLLDGLVSVLRTSQRRGEAAGRRDGEEAHRVLPAHPAELVEHAPGPPCRGASPPAGRCRRGAHHARECIAVGRSAILRSSSDELPVSRPADRSAGGLGVAVGGAISTERMVLALRATSAASWRAAPPSRRRAWTPVQRRRTSPWPTRCPTPRRAWSSSVGSSTWLALWCSGCGLRFGCRDPVVAGGLRRGPAVVSCTAARYPPMAHPERPISDRPGRPRPPCPFCPELRVHPQCSGTRTGGIQPWWRFSAGRGRPRSSRRGDGSRWLAVVPRTDPSTSKRIAARLFSM